MLDQVIKVIQNLGFPIFVAMWFMYRTDRRLDKMIKLMDELVSKHDNEEE